MFGVFAKHIQNYSQILDDEIEILNVSKSLFDDLKEISNHLWLLSLLIASYKNSDNIEINKRIEVIQAKINILDLIEFKILNVFCLKLFIGNISLILQNIILSNHNDLEKIIENANMATAKFDAMITKRNAK
jgi:hypothetical protein